MSDIVKEILKKLPEKKVSDVAFEAANIVLYTKDQKFFLEEQNLIRSIVGEIKKRIELRPDPSIAMEVEQAEKEIRKILTKDAGITQILFDAGLCRIG